MQNEMKECCEQVSERYGFQLKDFFQYYKQKIKHSKLLNYLLGL
jgi:hypothetical protein